MVKDIPVKVCYVDDHAKKGLVILSHGFTGNKEYWNEKMITLAKMGFYAVALDNRYHGERKGVSFKEKIMTGDGHIVLVTLRKVMNETALDISTLIDHFTSSKMIDTSKIGMIGMSMGGFVTYASLVNDKRISFAVPMISSPFWDDIPEDSRVLRSDEAIKEFTDYAAQNSPANHIEKFYPRKIFALIGKNDIHFKAERVVDFYDRLIAVYNTDSTNLKINQYDVGHEVNEIMWYDVVKWLKEEI